MLDIALCDLASALHPDTYGQIGWKCIGQTPSTAVCTGSTSHWGGSIYTVV